MGPAGPTRHRPWIRQPKRSYQIGLRLCLSLRAKAFDERVHCEISDGLHLMASRYDAILIATVICITPNFNDVRREV
jgi:hypothetical protein